LSAQILWVGRPVRVCILRPLLARLRVRIQTPALCLRNIHGVSQNLQRDRNILVIIASLIDGVFM
jgi:hypothetical protein